MRHNIDVEKPIYVNMFLGMRDEMVLYPDQNVAGDTFRDALQCGIKNSLDLDGASWFELSMQCRNDSNIVECSGILCDEGSDDYESYGSLADLADVYDNSAMEAFTALENWSGYISADMDDCLNPCSIYIDRLYVYPDYRRTGIASFIFDNIGNILCHKYKFNLRYVCIIVKPDDPTDMSYNAMYDIMTRTLISVGFTRIPCISGESIFAKRYI